MPSLSSLHLSQPCFLGEQTDVTADTSMQIEEPTTDSAQTAAPEQAANAQQATNSTEAAVSEERAAPVHHAEDASGVEQPPAVALEPLEPDERPYQQRVRKVCVPAPDAQTEQPCRAGIDWPWCENWTPF